MLITMSLLFIPLLGLLALVVDVGHLMIVRNELQNAADAAALAGANCLPRASAPSGTDCSSSLRASLNWTMAGIKASNTVGLNRSDGVPLVYGAVLTGYDDQIQCVANATNSGGSGGLGPITVALTNNVPTY